MEENISLKIEDVSEILFLSMKLSKSPLCVLIYSPVNMKVVMTSQVVVRTQEMLYIKAPRLVHSFQEVLQK